MKRKPPSVPKPVEELPFFMRYTPPKREDVDDETSTGLLTAILRRAVLDWVVYRCSPRIEKRRMAGQAYVWLYEECPGYWTWPLRLKEGREALSFLSICDMLKISPDAIRRRAAEMTAKDVQHLGRPATNRKLRNDG